MAAQVLTPETRATLVEAVADAMAAALLAHFSDPALGSPRTAHEAMDGVHAHSNDDRAASIPQRDEDATWGRGRLTAEEREAIAAHRAELRELRAGYALDEYEGRSTEAAHRLEDRLAELYRSDPHLAWQIIAADVSASIPEASA